MNFQNVSPRASAGGEVYTSANGYNYGGGGGGVLVNDQGPKPSSYQGQGYGGGGNGYSAYPDGMPGVILIEIKWKDFRQKSSEIYIKLYKSVHFSQ